jgi:hypothetical protein
MAARISACRSLGALAIRVTPIPAAHRRAVAIVSSCWSALACRLRDRAQVAFLRDDAYDIVP